MKDKTYRNSVFVQWIPTIIRGGLMDSYDAMGTERQSTGWVDEQTDSGLRFDGGEVSR